MSWLRPQPTAFSTFNAKRTRICRGLCVCIVHRTWCICVYTPVYIHILVNLSSLSLPLVKLHTVGHKNRYFLLSYLSIPSIIRLLFFHYFFFFGKSLSTAFSTHVSRHSLFTSILLLLLASEKFPVLHIYLAPTKKYIINFW